MANFYVRSTDGNNADNGSTWALAKATLAGAAAIDALGDVIFVSQAHNESTAGALNLSWAGSSNDVTEIICANDSAEPPTAVATTGIVSTTGANGITLASSSSNLYVYGLTFNAGTGAVSSNITLGGGSSGSEICRYEKCNFKLVATGGSNRIAITLTRVILEDCGFQFNSATQAFSITGTKVIVRGGSVLAGGTSPTTLFILLANGASELLVEGLDLSNCSAGLVLTSNVVTTFGYSCRFVNCKLPASWSGSPSTSTIPANSYVELINCSASSQNYAYWRREAGGEIRHETTVVRTGGASDGTTALSWKLSSNASNLNHTLYSPDIYLWNTATGSSVTATVEIVNDGSTLNDDEIWVEVLYLSSSSQPLGTHIRDSKADFLATAAAQTSSSVTWTTTGLSSPVKQKLAVTFTPQMVGFIIARVIVAKASTTVYVDPVITIT